MNQRRTGTFKFILGVVVLLSSCIVTNVPDPVPLLTTNFVSANIISAESGGVIISTGGFDINQKGLVWSTEPGATLENGSSTNEGPGNARFDSRMTGLQGLTTYYVRSYAISTSGIGYGNELEFTTGSCSTLSVEFNECDPNGMGHCIQGPVEVVLEGVSAYEFFTDIEELQSVEWTVAYGDITIDSGQGTSTIQVKFNEGFDIGCLIAQGEGTTEDGIANLGLKIND